MCKLKKRPRIYNSAKLVVGAKISLTVTQVHYLLHVLRLGENSEIFIFNGQDGEFVASLHSAKKNLQAKILHCNRPPEPLPSLRYYFAPIKKLRLDYMTQKAVEMGVGTICPVKTEYTQLDQLNYERLTANAIEAAEQCGVVYLPEINSICSFEYLLETWDVSYHLVFCDEKAASLNPLVVLREAHEQAKNLAVLVGPEGGFSKQERAALYDCNFASAISLGSNILRADTAAVAALSLVNAVAQEK